MCVFYDELMTMKLSLAVSFPLIKLTCIIHKKVNITIIFIVILLQLQNPCVKVNVFN